LRYATLEVLKNKQVSVMLQRSPSFMLQNINFYLFTWIPDPGIIEHHCQAEAGISGISAHTPLQFVL